MADRNFCDVGDVHGSDRYFDRQRRACRTSPAVFPPPPMKPPGCSPAIWWRTPWCCRPAAGSLCKFGRKRFLITCILIFTASSFMCGAATSLGMILIARAMQGAGGGALQPLSQAILLESFPPKKRGAAMALFAAGRCRRAGARAHAGRLANRPVLLALGLLHQHARRRAGDLHDLAVHSSTRLTSRMRRSARSIPSASGCWLSGSGRFRSCSIRDRKTIGSAPSGSAGRR